jgi:hypothetical protein
MYFNRFKGFPLKSKAFLGRLSCDLTAAIATRAACATTRAATAKTATR